jgi:putative ABC transport system substrate-binding protein
VVFLTGSDPVKSGLVSSINRPAENVTGIASMFTLLGTKNLELLHQLVPGTMATGVLANSTNPNMEHQLNDLHAAARALGISLDDEDSAIAALPKNQRFVRPPFAPNWNAVS